MNEWWSSDKENAAAPQPLSSEGQQAETAVLPCTAVTPSAVSIGGNPVQKALGIECTGLHAFRHAAASELFEEGAPLTVVQRHRDTRTTLQKYGHVVGDAQRRAVDTLAQKIERFAVGAV